MEDQGVIYGEGSSPEEVMEFSGGIIKAEESRKKEYGG
jgi:hypothetical protein